MYLCARNQELENLTIFLSEVRSVEAALGLNQDDTTAQFVLWITHPACSKWYAHFSNEFQVKVDYNYYRTF